MERFKNLLSAQFHFNYIYFGFLFLFFAFIHACHVCLLDQGSLFLRFYFILLAISESLFEVALLALLYAWIKRSLPQFAHKTFILFTFALIAIHSVDFFLIRLMDISFWYALSFMMDESIANFKELLYATHVSFWTWLFGALSAALLLFLGLRLFHFTDKFSQIKSRPIRCRTLLLSFAIYPLLFLAGNQLFEPHFPCGTCAEFHKVLPLKGTLLSSAKMELSLPSTVLLPEKEEAALERIKNFPLSIEQKPDIFIFVIESLREDFLTKEVAPHLHTFKKENLSSPLSLSGANGTQVSWFSIFFAKFPFHFTRLEPSHWKMGSPALQLLKKLGYSLHVISSVRLSYYQMDSLIFGEKEKLAEFSYFYPDGSDTKAYESDQKAIAKLLKEVKEHEGGGRCFLIFLESTHFDYSFPSKTFSRFQPITDNINYLSIAFSKKNLEKIKNRYRNSIYFLDALFGKFTEALKEKGLYKDSLIVVSGDHGEEFFEQGHLFHASNLSNMQTSVPIYYKLGDHREITPSAMSSHIDIFPTLFHTLLKDEKYASDLFDGRSIYGESRFPYTITARYNAGRAPFELLLNNGEYKLLTRFSNQTNIYKSENVKILDVRDLYDHSLHYSSDKIQNDFSKAFEKICIH